MNIHEIHLTSAVEYKSRYSFYFTILYYVERDLIIDESDEELPSGGSNYTEDSTTRNDGNLKFDDSDRSQFSCNIEDESDEDDVYDNFETTESNNFTSLHPISDHNKKRNDSSSFKFNHKHGFQRQNPFEKRRHSNTSMAVHDGDRTETKKILSLRDESNHNEMTSEEDKDVLPPRAHNKIKKSNSLYIPYNPPNIGSMDRKVSFTQRIMNSHSVGTAANESESTVSIYLKTVDTKRYAARMKDDDIQGSLGVAFKFRPEVENGDSLIHSKNLSYPNAPLGKEI